MRVFDRMITGEMSSTWKNWCGIVAAASVAVAGCGRSKIERPPTFPVSGRVLANRKPAASGRVQLWALDDPQLFGLCPHAIVESDGSFRVTTYNTGDGALPGLYALTVTWPLPPRPGMDEGPDRFGGRYSDPLRPVRQVRITTANNELEAIQLE